ncbi:cation diffusion facilitator family transporter [Desulfothermobacter acidiphilus]|uniref:cation diffusion facilitator family transporter n=1 Tax=Desulfothermobacter acidiphilus TaxID=1938353 RepID=UPI003F893380
MAEKGKRAVVAALMANSLIAAAKFVAAWLTHSSAMFAEGLHSLADVGNQVLLLVGINRSSRPPDHKHPFGYGKERYFWSFLVAVTMFFVGSVLSVYRGLEGIFNPRQLEDPLVNYVVLGLSLLFEGYSLRVAMSEAKQLVRGAWLRGLKEIKDPTLLVVLFEDSAALLGLLLALLGVSLSAISGRVIFDALASIFIGLILGTVAFHLARHTMDFLIGRSASPEQCRLIAAAVREVPEVAELVELLTMHIGPDQILVNLSVNFKDGLDTDQIEQAIDKIEKKHPPSSPRS